ncbi:hypothetical protein [Curvivirga aplysinae]|uniref:hypothetical protein n=1 Tax=Curvivirga aplysinae TaxID=2529852 RepID=UPI0012BB83EF|nr:hypothetical protein [Curvivirga aplysinae]MTI10204.1 hypothetical protein [Curvivirga aplysinae]
MRDYGKINTTIWQSKRFLSLADDKARLFYLYLHTSTHTNSIGCYRLQIGYAMADLGWAETEVLKAIDSLCKALLIEWNKDESILKIAKFLEKSPTTNKKHAIGAVKLALALPDCDLKANVIKDLKADKYACDLDELKGLSIAYRNPIDTTEPEPEPEPETDSLVVPENPSLPPKKTKRGTRLPEDWEPTEKEITFAHKEGLTDEQICIEARKFKNYWIGKSGQAATKVDWYRTWENWILNDYSSTSRNRSGQGGRSGGGGSGTGGIVSGYAQASAEIDAESQWRN